MPTLNTATKAVNRLINETPQLVEANPELIDDLYDKKIAVALNEQFPPVSTPDHTLPAGSLVVKITYNREKFIFNIHYLLNDNLCVTSLTSELASELCALY